MKCIMKNNVLICCVIILVIPEFCYAYIDPSSGSPVIQTVIAFVVGCLFMVKQFWKKIVYFSKGLFGKNKIEEDKDVN